MTEEFKPVCDGYTATAGSGSRCFHFISPQFCKLSMIFRCIEYLRKHEPTLSYSSVHSYTHCHRKYYLGNIRGLQLKRKPLVMVLGDIAHEILRNLHDASRKEPYNYRSRLRHYYEQFSEGQNSDYTPTSILSLVAVFDAYTELHKHEEKGITEYHVKWKGIETPEVTGYVDLLNYEGHMGKEFKYTRSPDWYTRFTISDQFSTYFLSVPSLEKMTLRKIIQPDLKLGKNEGIKTFRERVYQDIMSRPTHYFRDDPYWRIDFNLEETKQKIKVIAKEIMGYAEIGMNAFYQNKDGCFTPKQCEFYGICSHNNVISEDLYEKRTLVDKSDKNVDSSGADAPKAE